jgi:hypothetical protein
MFFASSWKTPLKTISNFNNFYFTNWYLHQFFGDRYSNTPVIQVLTFLEPDSNGPGKKLQVISAFRCGRVH